MQFQVPQLETESRIVGPFSIVQFIYIALSALVCFLLFSILEPWLWFIVSAVIIGSALAIALIKINGRPMHAFLLAALNYFWQPKRFALKPSLAVTGLKNIPTLPYSEKKIIVREKLHVPEETYGNRMIERPVIVPVIAISPAVEEPKHSSLIQDLFDRISMTSSPIPQRESSIKKEEVKAVSRGYEPVLRPTGDTELIKRVDYRA